MNFGEYDSVLVTFADDETEPLGAMRALSNTAGLGEEISVAAAAAGGQPASTADVYFERFGVAVLRADPDQLAALQRPSTAARGLIVEPNLPTIALGVTDDYVRGYADGVADLSWRLLGDTAEAARASLQQLRYRDSDELTWGLQAIGVDVALTSDGAGIKVAILDTGIDDGHPDFQGRQITAASFVPNETYTDMNGHGTHCAGTACGPARPSRGPRYGVAPDAELLVGKVLGNNGRGRLDYIIAGLQWAYGAKADIVSMSLGFRSTGGYSAAVERAAQRMLRDGVLIVAASGNDSDRPNDVDPVSGPANCPSILAVGAVDQSLQPARFSNGTDTQEPGSRVDLVGPGVRVWSAYTQPRSLPLSGTSMATPHVAGVAACMKERNPGMDGARLWSGLIRGAKSLSESPASAVGAGLVHMPG